MSGEESPLIGDGAGYSSINNSTFTSPKLRPISTSSNNTAISEISKYLHSDLTKSIGRLGSFILLTNNITG